MKKASLHSLTKTEFLLIAETQRDAMADLSEDELLALHTRVRRARTKYTTLYRRGASGRVGDLGGRGFAGPKNNRDRDKAEIFEKALGRVSKQVSVAAKVAAKELKAERLAAARNTGAGPHVPQPGESGVSGPTSTKGTHKKTTGGKKRDASTRSQGARRQAKRDSR